MPVKLKISKSKVMAIVTGVFKEALPILSEEILNDCNEYCKEDTGMLIASSYIHSKPDEGKLIWQTPYARRQYWGIPTAYQTVNKKAVWKWCEFAKKEYGEKWNRDAQKLINGEV